ncbi:MAG: LamG domain-containing protein, partial [Candidatus Harrisonbacteria bacterium]|nr:LamG domain-containing protein [Candidatus Harrisonbacteria bacterium]
FDAVPITSLSVLPVDPVNNVGNYYTYVTGGSWALSTLFESERYAEQAATDGGPDPAQYEVGTDLTIAPFVRGMVGYWKFDELSGPFLEDSSGNNTGTANGGAVFGSVGKVGRAVTFDGVNDYITMGNNSSLFPSSKIAIAFWTRLSLLPNGVADFTQHVAGGGSNVFIRTTSGNKINFSLIDGVGWKGVTSNTILTQNQWYHVVGNYDGGSIKIYINGVSENTFPASGNINKGIPFNYFNISGATGGTTARITGLIDDLRLYNRALTNSEIQAMYNATK